MSQACKAEVLVELPFDLIIKDILHLILFTLLLFTDWYTIL